jgi:hypothetical protein
LPFSFVLVYEPFDSYYPHIGVTAVKIAVKIIVEFLLVSSI